jgi:hypothetical protein
LLIGQTSNSAPSLEYKFSNLLDIEFDLNFKGIQTSREKSLKFSKIMICQGLHKYSFRSPHLYRKFPCSFTRAYEHLKKIERRFGFAWLMTWVRAYDFQLTPSVLHAYRIGGLLAGPKGAACIGPCRCGLHMSQCGHHSLVWP